MEIYWNTVGLTLRLKITTNYPSENGKELAPLQGSK